MRGQGLSGYVLGIHRHPGETVCEGRENLRLYRSPRATSHHNAVRGGPTDRATATEYLVKFSSDASRQTDRQTNLLITILRILPGEDGKVTNSPLRQTSTRFIVSYQPSCHRTACLTNARVGPPAMVGPGPLRPPPRHGLGGANHFTDKLNLMVVSGRTERGGRGHPPPPPLTETFPAIRWTQICR